MVCFQLLNRVKWGLSVISLTLFLSSLRLKPSNSFITSSSIYTHSLCNRHLYQLWERQCWAASGCDCHGCAWSHSMTNPVLSYLPGTYKPQPSNPPKYWPKQTSRWCCPLRYQLFFNALNILESDIHLWILDFSLCFQCMDVKVNVHTLRRSLSQCCDKVNERWGLFGLSRYSWLQVKSSTLFPLISTRVLSAEMESHLHGQIPVMSSLAPRGDHPHWEQGGDGS